MESEIFTDLASRPIQSTSRDVPPYTPSPGSEAEKIRLLVKQDIIFIAPKKLTFFDLFYVYLYFFFLSPNLLQPYHQTS